MARADYFWGGLMLGAPAGALVVALIGCTARQTAKSEYDGQSEGCVRIYESNAPAQKSCLDYVRAKWTKAGAPAAAVDGGDQ